MLLGDYIRPNHGRPVKDFCRGNFKPETELWVPLANLTVLNNLCSQNGRKWIPIATCSLCITAITALYLSPTSDISNSKQETSSNLQNKSRKHPFEWFKCDRHLITSFPCYFKDSLYVWLYVKCGTLLTK